MSDFSSASSLASLDTNSITSDLEDFKSIIPDDIFQNDNFKVSDEFCQSTLTIDLWTGSSNNWSA